jgi:tRNA (guanine-N7-)-methyltransferase
MPFEDNRLIFYGRRHGRRLRQRQVEYLDRGMAMFGLPLDLPQQSTTFDPRVLYTDTGSGLPSSPPEKIYLEIGFGGGEHLAACAEQNPKAGYLGAEPFINGVASLCRHLIERKITNTRIWAEDIRLLLPSLVAGSLDGVFVLFPDPWPKARHQGRRIIQPAMLDELSRLIRHGGEMVLASDDAVAKTWLLEQMMRRDDFTWTARTAAAWRVPPASSPGTRYPTTRYMAKADRAGRTSSWFVFTRTSRTCS